MKWLFILALSSTIFATNFQDKLAQYKAADNLEEYIYTYLDKAVSKDVNAITLLQNCKENIWRKAKTKKEELAFVYFWANYAYYLKQKGFLQKSAKAYQKAWQLFNTNQLTNFEIYESCLKPLANSYTRLGDYEKAINTHKLILEHAQDSDNESLKTGTLINIAIIYHDLGRVQDAVDLLIQAKNVTKLSDLHHLLIYSKLAKNYLLLNKIARAETYAQQIHKKTAYEKAIYNKLKARINQKKGNLERAIYFGTIAIKQLKKSKARSREIAKAYVELGRMYYHFNNTKQALVSSNNALKTLINKTNCTKQDIYPENTFKEIFDLEATILIAKKEYSKALKKLDLAFYTDTLLRETFNHQESKLFLQHEIQKRSELAIETCLKNQDTVKAFWYAQHNKSLILSNEYFFNKSKLNYASDSLIIREKQLKQLATKLKNKESNYLAYYNKTVDDLAQTRTLINEKYHFETPKNTSLKTIQEQLKGSNSSLLLFFEGTNNSFYFTVTSSKLNINSYKTDTILSDFIKRFEKYNRLEENFKLYKTQAYELYQRFNFDAIQTEKIIIIPDGIINVLPFEALLTKESNATSFSKLPYLLLKKEITYAYSPNLYFSQKDKQNSNAKLLAIAPIFKNSSNYLKYAALELASIQKETNGLFLSNNEATKQAFIKQAKHFDALHISTHATSTNTPYIQFKDSIITLDEIYGLSLKANLVVLSACKTGTGKIQKGEGTLSLGRGFKYAGASSIIQSLWQVNDKATALLMHNFYKNLTIKTTKIAALRKAKLNYLNNKNIKSLKKSPYYWAAFQYYGSNDVLVFQKARKSTTFYYGIAAFTLFLVLFIAIKYKK